MPESYRAAHGSSFTAMPPGVLVNSRPVSEEDIQIALAPYIQTYLSQTGRRHSCCSVMLPVAFERAAPKSWLDPSFDSAVLEGQYRASVFPQIRLRFRFALLYILLCSLVWMLYFCTDTGPTRHHIIIASCFGVLIVATLALIWLTYRELYRAHTTLFSAGTAISLSIASLLFLVATEDSFSPLGHFAICVTLLMLIYTVVPLRLWQTVGIASGYSIAFEWLQHGIATNFYIDGKSEQFAQRVLMLRILLQLCVHLVGVHVLVMNVVRMRGTFMKVGQNLLVRRQLEMEKQLKEKMIHSVMPPKVADMLLKEVVPGTASMQMSHAAAAMAAGVCGGSGGKPLQRHSERPRTSNDVKSLFRPFHMHSMENVSILFADIVGFTKMSSTKTAEQLVEILNDLFERFDELCTNSGCEKISTLGDCYYCVSGCPEPRADHAVCCVEMGLGMIEVMRVFDVQRNEEVRMRVGVHTGTVLCGIVGTRRVKFDVWSNDVSFANKMESSGRPEQVHISEQTCNFLGERYHLEDGEDVDGHRTYFVLGRRKDRQNSSYSTATIQSDFDDTASQHQELTTPTQHQPNHTTTTNASHRLLQPNGFTNGVALSLSATNVSNVQPSVPPASPVGPQTSASLNPSPLMAPRLRLASFGKVAKFLSAKHHHNAHNNHQQPPDQPQKSQQKPPPLQQQIAPTIIVSTRSLPESLQSAELAAAAAATAVATGSATSPLHHRGVNNLKNGTLAAMTHSADVAAAKTQRSAFWRVPKFLQRSSSSSQAVILMPSDGTHNPAASQSNATVIDMPSLSPLLPVSSNAGSNSNASDASSPAAPIIITTTNCLDVPATAGRRTHHSSFSSSRSPAENVASRGSTSSPHSMLDMVDIIDVRSYISQSRSDISPFARSGSYRSQTHATSGGCARAMLNDLSPCGRPRALTVAAPHANVLQNHHVQQPQQQQQPQPWDMLSMCPSAHSRKDSGIRSNSRRSSIQPAAGQRDGTLQRPDDMQLLGGDEQEALQPNYRNPYQNQQHHQHQQQRVSGYFTSSESSIVAATASGSCADHLPEPVHTPAAQHPDPLGACLQQLRKQSDLQLIRCVRDNARSQRSYLVKPPLSPATLFFKSDRMELEFRGQAHRFGCELQNEGPPTLATPKYNTYIDILVGMMVYFGVAAALFLLSAGGDVKETTTTTAAPFRVWVALFAIFTVGQFAALLLFTKQICHFSRRRQRRRSGQRSASAASERSSLDVGRESTTTADGGPTCDDTVLEWLSSWYPWHIALACLMALPVVLIIANFVLLQDLGAALDTFEYHYGFMVFVCIVHFCNFTQLNCWMRNCLALLTAVAFVGITLGQMGPIAVFWEGRRLMGNGTGGGGAEGMAMAAMMTEKTNSFQAYQVEIYLDLLLVLVLVWFLNREFEIGYRLTFYGNAVALKDKVQVQNMKNQADMLLHNIIPKHVAEHLKNTAKYSENHRRVAIIFASIVNFNELYDESYLGGKEYLRVLNELIGDFDELLCRPDFRCVEKIKTIGSTFMAASGLDPKCRGNGDEHVFALMRFAVAMQQVVEDFNKDLLEFNLVLRIGFNVGEVTAGVIGTSKLHYDIWGDAVNVASRMDSTGVAGRIQVGAEVVRMLEQRWAFEPRGEVYVKGKDHMEVFLVRQDADAPEDVVRLSDNDDEEMEPGRRGNAC